MILKGKCNCGEKVNCGCTLSFSSHVANSVSVLDVGTLQGGSCSFSEYVIDWYRNGEHAMVSGVGYDPDIQSYHPFTGNGAIPVPGGTWVPVVRHVVLDGQTERIFTSPKKCNKWCEFISELPTINVSSLDCSTVLNPNANYQVNLNYSTTQDYSLASRTLIWNLESSVKALAFYFSGSDVADQLDIYWKDETTPLISWICGTQLISPQVDTLPYQSYGSVSFIIPLPEFSVGDYITIKVTPSVLEVNPNTIWALGLECFDQTTFDALNAECAAVSAQKRLTPDYSTFSMVEDPANCRNLFTYYLSDPILPISSFPLLNKYAGFAIANVNSHPSLSEMYTTGKVVVPLNKTYSGNANSCVGVKSCTNALGTISFTKSANIFTIQYTDENDYLVDKGRYSLFLNSSCYTLYSSDPTLVQHYHFFNYVFRVASTCGDSYTQYNIYGHLSSPVTWDDINLKWTVEILNVTNQYVSLGSCDTTSSRVNTYINQVNSTLNNTTINGKTTNIQYGSFTGTRVNTVSSFVTSQYHYLYHHINKKRVDCSGINTMCSVSALEYRLYISLVRVIITNINDPANNYEVYDSADHETGCQITQVLLYKKQNGIQIYP